MQGQDELSNEMSPIIKSKAFGARQPLVGAKNRVYETQKDFKINLLRNDNSSEIVNNKGADE